MKILIAPADIAGYYGRLREGFVELGVDCDFANLHTSPFLYESTHLTSSLIGRIRNLNALRGSEGNSLVKKIILASTGELLSFALLARVARKYDVFIFPFGKSFTIFANLDIVFLRLIGKTVIVNMGHGADSRPPFMDGAYQKSNGGLSLSIPRLLLKAMLTRATVRRAQGLASIFVGSPFNASQFARSKFFNFLELGYPAPKIDLRSDEQKHVDLIHAPARAAETIRLLHAPSHPAAKGSDIIRQAVINIKAQGVNIELIEVKNRPNHEVLEEIRKADLILDQVFSDVPMAGLASEAAALGKPSLVGGYAFELGRNYVSKEMWPPTITCSPEDFEATLVEALRDLSALSELGLKAQGFVRNQYSPRQVAERYLLLIQGAAPESWLIDPRDITYVHGAGQDFAKTLDNVRELKQKFGLWALGLWHRPDLTELLET